MKTQLPSIIYICTHNSARSQMAEALMRHHFGEKWNVFSAGTESTFVKKPALIVLQEHGVDTTGLFSKTLNDLEAKQFDVVITVCDDAKENCPYLPGIRKTIHKSFPDPSHMGSNDAENLNAFRNVRNAIESWILETF